ncbi:MAG: cytochrome P450 [Nocardiopsaceae bacterium]|nr:cytochrome P450 [Nocardiopsaceae bacterium]
MAELAVPFHKERDPYGPGAELRRVQKAGPVSRVDLGKAATWKSVWLVTGYAEAREVLGDFRRFSTQAASNRSEPGGASTVAEAGDLAVGNLLTLDPPEHTRMRKLVAPWFTTPRVRAMVPRITEIVRQRLDDMAASGPPADLMRRFGWPVPVELFAEVLGIPRDDWGQFGRQLMESEVPGSGRDRQMRAGSRVSDYITWQVSRQRKNPGDNFIGGLASTYGDQLRDDEITGICMQLIRAGVGNISGMLGLGVLVLLENPDQLPVLDSDAETVDRAVEELVRYLSIAHAPSPRVALDDTTLGGQPIKAGDVLICSLPAANRDTAVVPDPDRVDLARPPGPHVAFGYGPHHCLGAVLTKTVLRIAYGELFRRLPGLELTVAASDVQFRTEGPTYGVKTLPITWCRDK